MKLSYSLVCQEWNAAHVRFHVFDRNGAKCGDLTLETSDVVFFARYVWDGTIDWMGLLPDDVATNPEKYGGPPK